MRRDADRGNSPQEEEEEEAMEEEEQVYRASLLLESIGSTERTVTPYMESSDRRVYNFGLTKTIMRISLMISRAASPNCLLNRYEHNI